MLIGELGVGKTTLTKGVAEGLGVLGCVRSPTFAFVHRHAGRHTLLHVDLYRIQRPSELYELGLQDLLDPDAVTVVEWGDRLGGRFGEDVLRVTLHFGEDRKARLLRACAFGERSERLLKGWESLCAG